MSGGVLTPRVEVCMLAAGILVAAITLIFRSSATPMIPVIALCVGATVLWITWQDLRLFTISDMAILTLAALAVAYRLGPGRSTDMPLQDASITITLDAFLPGAILFGFREVYYQRRGYDGLGLGDVKLASVGGILVGVLGFSYALLAASVVGLVVVAFGRAFLGAFARTEKLAFGAFLAPALWAVWGLEQVPSFARLLGT